MGPASPTLMSADTALSLASQLPQLSGFRQLECNPPVGASLLAKGPAHSTSLASDRPLSRAGSLLQVSGFLQLQCNPLWERACSRWRRHIQRRVFSQPPESAQH
ncbi:hypothetical protein C2E19_07695 [Pseudomonas sp. DTU12.3]|nr:hypothetical protein C2E19_07695 [Pseudomonas sp. DTU12.3]